MKVRVYCENEFGLPLYETEGSVGMDLVANDAGIIPAGDTILVPTGIYVEVPMGYEMQVRPRSGLAVKKGLTILNSPGTIDSDYRGEIGVILHNTRNTDYYVDYGDRIAQMVLCPTIKCEWERVDTPDGLSFTNRGEDGFGSTG